MIGHGALDNMMARVWVIGHGTLEQMMAWGWGDRGWCIRTYDDVRVGDRAWCKKRSLFFMLMRIINIELLELVSIIPLS